MPDVTDRFRGQVALVTGASRGIGRTTALRLASEGADIVLNYASSADSSAHSAKAGQETAASIRELGVQVLAFDADVSDRDAVRAMSAAAESHFGHIDVVVNNAGIGIAYDLVDTPEDAWDRMLAVDLKGQFLVAQAVVSGMMRRGSGILINVTSEQAIIGAPRLAAYCAAKAGVIGLTKALARELAPFGILVNAVAPGPTDTDLLTPEERTEEYIRTIPLHRLGRPDDIAAAICFLASPDSSWTTGQILSPNGGTVI